MSLSFSEYYQSDMERYCGGVNRSIKKFHFYLRKCQTTKNKWVRIYYRFRFSKIKSKYGIEMSYQTKIGKGLYIGHPYHITINPAAELGENINIHKNVTIGRENRGNRKGCPTIGNRVWIGIGATIVGKIKVGNDVLIAPGAYVNRDIPDHSVVIGNPCIIKYRDNAVEGYVCHPYTEIIPKQP